MIGEREHTFEDLTEVGAVTISLSWLYEFTRAKTDGKPENCCPESLEMEVVPMAGWETAVANLYLAAAKEAVKQIQAEINDLDPSEWAEEAQQAAAEGRAEDRYERRAA